MRNIAKLKKIASSKLCIGCGLCEGELLEGKCEMSLSESGFYKPVINQKKDSRNIKKIIYSCPGVNFCDKCGGEVWGEIKQIYESWSNDSSIRYTAASGGVITSLAIFMLENKYANGVLHVGPIEGKPLENELKLSKTKEDVIRNASSRYAPVVALNKLNKFLSLQDDSYVFIGKPCDVQAVKKYLSLTPEYAKRIKLFISFFCAGVPSINAVKKIILDSNIHSKVASIKYRGDGWPGLMKIMFENGYIHSLSYKESWGNVLGKNLHFRCKICPDGVGLNADIVVGDSWDEINGYPKFNESEGRSMVIIRSENGEKVFSEAKKNGVIRTGDFQVQKINSIQAYQYNRRIYAGYRLIPVFIYCGFCKWNSLIKLFELMRMGSPIIGIKELLGTVKRIFV